MKLPIVNMNRKPMPEAEVRGYVHGVKTSNLAQEWTRTPFNFYYRKSMVNVPKAAFLAQWRPNWFTLIPFRPSVTLDELVELNLLFGQRLRIELWKWSKNKKTR